MRRLISALLMTTALATLTGTAATAADEARLLRTPAISADHLAFAYAGDLWIGGRDGGPARRLTTDAGTETNPHFSPDGSLVAFSATYDGNIDVYVVGVDGGEPRRLTWHPGRDLVRGWTIDGKGVLFASGRASAPYDDSTLWTVGLSGGMPTALPVGRAWRAAYSPDGRQLAYEMVEPWEVEFRNYRGGQVQPVRLIDLETLETRKIPGADANNLCPVWLDGTVYFLSDRDLAMNVWAFDVASGALTQVTRFKEFDCKNMSGGAGAVVFENGGFLYRLDKAGALTKLSFTVNGDFPWARPHWEDTAGSINTAALSPAGQRAVFESRGDIYTVPAEKGDIRNLTNSSGAADREPSWSPDGKTVSWFSDEGGEYQLVLADQMGQNRRLIKLDHPTFYYTPVWSPDSKHLAFTDAARVLWILDVASGKAREVDNEGSAHPERHIRPVWSPDSKWLAYSRRLPNQFNAVFIHSLDSGTSTRLTDGLSDALSPAWEKSGKYLAFLASTDFGMNVGWLDMSSYERPENFAIYLAVLDKETPSPFMPESDDEDAKAEDDKADESKKDGAKKDKDKDADEEKKPTPVKIDFEGLSGRIIALDVPAGRYSGLTAGAEGKLFYTQNVEGTPGLTLHRYDFTERESKPAATGINGFRVSADGKKLLLQKPDNQFAIMDADADKDEGNLDLKGMKMYLDPAAEWKQMFREAVRYQRDFFYVKNVHGLDLDWAEKTYGSWLPHVRHRDDLNYVLDILGGETSIGHSFTGGGDYPDVKGVGVGLLGCDFTVKEGRYLISTIFTGESWNPDLKAPLSGPGIDVREGDFLLAVAGRQLTADLNPYSLFENRAGQQTVITVSSRSDGKDSRDVTVVPVPDEGALRRFHWVEGNRRKVDELSGGKLAYVWVPDTGGGGYSYFNRYYFAQQDKQGAVIDERFNHGGSIADHMVDLMSRKLLGFFNNPVGDKQPWTAPNAAIWGPKVMIINEMAGSGGDMLPYMFRKMNIGPLVGTRTWGGLVGIWDVPGLVDGGGITAPRGGFYDTDGQWAVENEGVAPDIEVEMDPKLASAGRDPQLEAAVKAAQDLMKTQAVKILPQPADPVRAHRPK
jgi:tricorn protease